MNGAEDLCCDIAPEEEELLRLIDLVMRSSSQRRSKRHISENVDGKKNFLWTVGSCLIDYDLKHAGADGKARFEQKVPDGYMVWHAFLVGALGFCADFTEFFEREGRTGAAVVVCYVWLKRTNGIHLSTTNK